jgi:hypothetical protein
MAFPPGAAPSSAATPGKIVRLPWREVHPVGHPSVRLACWRLIEIMADLFAVL